MNEGTTHYAGCIQAGPKHYECALQEIGRLRGTITHLRAELEKETQRRFDGNEIASKEHREEVAAMMKMGDRLIAERKEWVGLTDDEIKGCIETTIEITDCLLLDAVNAVIIDVETMLKRKNT